jgi:hypothetical protein
MKKCIKQTSLFLRAAYLIGWLRSWTGQTFPEIERQVRENQFEKYGLVAPARETVRDYFLLRSTPQYDPMQNLKRHQTPPWLLALELEVPGSAFAFFHPLFNLLSEPLESSLFWQLELQKPPVQWIEYSEGRKDYRRAQRFREELAAKRKHRKFVPGERDPLRQAHYALMSLPKIGKMFFKELHGSDGWGRKYAAASTEVGKLQRISTFDSLAGLLALVVEAAAIGDSIRLNLAREALLAHLEVLDSLPECRRVRSTLKAEIRRYCRDRIQPLFYGSGPDGPILLPNTWEAGYMPVLVANRMVGPRLPWF